MSSSISGPEAEPARLSTVENDVMNALRGRFDTVMSVLLFTGHCFCTAEHLLIAILINSDMGTEDLMNESVL